MSLPVAGHVAFPRERVAVSTLFFANGYVYGNWAPTIPALEAAHGIDEATVGLLIVAIGVGALVAMPVAAAIMARDGSRRLALVAALALAPVLLLVDASGPLWLVAAMLALFGALAAAMDVAMNANAVAVEGRLGRPMLSSCHGSWSVGGLVGAASGGVLIATAGPAAHATTVAAVALALVLAVAGSLLHDEPVPAAPREPREAVPRAAIAPRRLFAALAVGSLALLSYVPEGAVLDWGALYLRQDLLAPESAAGLAFASFSAAMATMRLGGDAIRDRLGAVATMRLSALVGATGFLVAASADGLPAVAFGFALAGCGIANLLPIAICAAGNLPGLPPGFGISVASFLGYGGLLVAPSLIGFVARHTGLGPVWAAMPLVCLVVFALSGLVRHADTRG